MDGVVNSIWDDCDVRTSHVMSNIGEANIIHVDGEEDVCEEVVQNGNENEVQLDDVMYITDEDIAVARHQSHDPFQYEFLEVSSEEIVADQWAENCSEVVVGSDLPDQTSDIEIPLPTDQDEYTASRPYPCDFCSRRFRKKANLMNHMVAHQTDRPHGCNLCGVRYIRKCDLMNHLKVHAYVPDSGGFEEDDPQTMDESDGEKYRKKCKPFVKKRKKFKEELDFDNEIATSSHQYNYIDDNMRLLQGSSNASYVMDENRPVLETRFPITDPRKPFVCQHCGVGFTREKALASHARVHGGDSPFECRSCEEVFWDVSLLREHIHVKHGGMEQSFDDEDYEDEEYSGYEDEDVKYGQFFCPSCGMSFHRQDNMRRHQRVHIKEEHTRDEYGHICNVCGESFPEALELLAHAEIHTRGWEHRCMICGELCVDDQAVATHVQAKHGPTLPPNTCLQCGRTCKDRRTLVKHSFEHSREKLFACNKCDKTFHNKARLKRHMISHRNKVVSCEECGEDFPDGRSLMNHRHSHSSVSGRNFPCRECGKTFGSRSSQQIHVRIHTGERPYGCRFCWKAFADGGTLRKHERIHTGEKPYACAVCPRAFNQRVVLREHIRSHHSGPDPNYSHSMTPFSCLVCSDLFATSQDLITHLIHHCDLNTAMKRQPQVGPRKYKRRRKLKPHELELMSTRTNYEDEAPHMSNSEDDDDFDYKKKIIKKQKKTPPKSDIEESYADVYNSFSSAIENINSIVNSKSNKAKKKLKMDLQPPPQPLVLSRPKMIHTQKTRVPVDPLDGGKVRHKTKTLVTHTQPTELKSATGERIRPRTKNVSYHILQSEKLPVATFPEDDTEQAVNNLLASDTVSQYNEENDHSQTNGLIVSSEVTIEQAINSDLPLPTNIIKIANNAKKKSYSLRPGRTIIGPGSKLVRFLKDGGGMLVSKTKWLKDQPDPLALDNEDIKPDLLPPQTEEFEQVEIKKEAVVEPSPLQELAEVSVKQAEKMLKCDMCSKLFTDRDQLLEHVRIHICL